MMLAIVRKSLASLLSNHNSSLFSVHFFSTWRDTQNVICPKVYDLLFLKHHFPPELASQIASNLRRPRSPENADSILSFLKDSGCSTTQLQKIVNYDPRVLYHSVEDIELKIKILKNLGLSDQDIAKMISNNPVILHLSAKSKIIPSLTVLKGLLGSDNDVARLLRKSGWPLSSNLDDTLVPNAEFLKSVGIPMDRILFLLYVCPRSLLIKPNAMRKSVEKAKEMGFNERSKMFVHALKIITTMSKGMWEVKLQSFQEMGFSESESLTMFKKFPPVFQVSMEKVEKVKQLLLATGKFDMSSVVQYPTIFSYSVEQRIEPRLRILKILESKNLIKWPALGSINTLTEDAFFEKYVRPYLNEVGNHLPQGRKLDETVFKHLVKVLV